LKTPPLSSNPSALKTTNIPKRNGMIISKDHLFMNTFRKPGIERTFLFIQLKVLSSNPSTAKKKKKKKGKKETFPTL
jgi:hypothetical protein